MEQRKELELYQELKDKAYSIEGDSIQELMKKKNIYDIDPIINYNLLKSLLENDNDDFINHYLSSIQTLTFNQKLDINKKLKNHPSIEAGIKTEIGIINNNSYIDNYFSILKKIYNYLQGDVLKFSDFKTMLRTEYYVDNSGLKIPLIYGTRELNFSYLINNIYNYFILYNEPQENNKKDKNDKTNINNLNKDLKVKDHYDSILERRDNPNEKEMEIENEEKNTNLETKNINVEDNNNIATNNNNINNSNNNINTNNNTNNNINKIFHKKCRFIESILGIIFNEKDFFKIFQIENYKKEEEIKNFLGNYKLKPNLDALYFHLLFLDFIICINTLEKKDKFLTEKIEMQFFEEKKKKLNSLKYFLQYVDIETNEGKKIDFKKLRDVKNEIYKCYDKKNNNNFFFFNPYEHILSYINYENFESFKNEFNNKEYFSLLKYFNKRQLFQNNNLNNLFKGNIKEMFQSKIIDESFSQFTNFSKFANPYNGKKKNEFIKQTMEIILYFPFPTEKIWGFTYKNSGLIFINNVNDNKKFVESTYIIYDICKLAINKVTFMHEIIAHYTSIICHANDIENKFLITPSSFKNYFPIEEYLEIYDSYDAGDRIETLIFGDKIKTLFIQGALFILDKNNWNSFNQIEDFQKNFFENNKFNEKNLLLNIVELKEKDNLIKELLDSYNQTSLIKLNKRNSSFVFRSTDDNIKNKKEKDCNICWERINKTQLPYQKNFN